MEFYKFLTAALVAAAMWHMFRLWRIGRKMARAGADEASVSHHQSMVGGVVCCTLAAVVLIEIQVRLSPEPYASGALLMSFHLVVVAMLVVTFLAIVLRFTGLRDPWWHRRLAYLFFTLYVTAFATGAVMLYNLPVKAPA